MRLKKVRSPIPRVRATSISGLVSAEKVTIPSTSAEVRPASSRAAATASVARRSSLRPELGEFRGPDTAHGVVPAKAWCLGDLALTTSAPVRVPTSQETGRATRTVR